MPSGDRRDEVARRCQEHGKRLSLGSRASEAAEEQWSRDAEGAIRKIGGTHLREHCQIQITGTSMLAGTYLRNRRFKGAIVHPQLCLSSAYSNRSRPHLVRWGQPVNSSEGDHCSPNDRDAFVEGNPPGGSLRCHCCGQRKSVGRIGPDSAKPIR